MHRGIERRSRGGGRRLLLTGAALAALAGCDFFTATDCHAGIRLEVAPPSIALGVGESFRPEYREVGCEWERTVSQTWVTNDSTVVEIDGTGRVLALRAGTAWVWPQAFPAADGQLRIDVTVTD